MKTENEIIILISTIIDKGARIKYIIMIEKKVWIDYCISK